VEHVGVHAIRHSTATILQAAGVDEPTRMRLMGHSSAASQRGYVHVDQTQTRLALQNLNQLLP
jgi:site-specific recombinase XerD